jgi:hypothetical protein
MTDNIWKLLEDPVEAVLRRIWLTEALKEVLDGEDLESGIDAWEYRDHYADGIVRSSWNLAWSNGLAKTVSPTIELHDDCGWRLTNKQIAEIFVAKQYGALASRFYAWEKDVGAPLRERLLDVYAHGGDEALNRFNAEISPRTQGSPGF